MPMYIVWTMEYNRVLPDTQGLHRRVPPHLIIVMWCLGVFKSSQPFDYGYQDNWKLSPVRGTEISKRRPNRVLTLSSTAVPFTLMTCSLSLAVLYLFCYFGRLDHYLRFVSFFICYWLTMVITQVIFTTASLKNLCKNSSSAYTDDIRWHNALNGTAFLRNLSVQINSHRGPWPNLFTFGFFIVFASFVALINIYFFTLLEEKCRNWTGYIWLVCDTLNLMFYGMSCYFLYLQRTSLQAIGKKVAVCVGENIVNFDYCTNQIKKFFREYLQLRKIILPWLRIIIFTSSFGLTVFFTWNYEENKYLSPSVLNDNQLNATFICSYACDKASFLKERNVLLFYNVLVISRNLMIAILALTAVGGFDIAYIWERFNMRLHFLTTASEGEQWKRLINFVKKLHPSTHAAVIFSFVIPLLGFGSAFLSNKHF
ncbi:hypothetical protein HOLleu_40585 [Holothuria leucospilota]|uniref:Uncharacterized protein n=1 Tax=Holothuria leucospilota TaxID=206669 RepID=A0A9Q0YIG3_HOLLE|nr:hypothetical protein HOLleu_40585 [Holothuria leucospilota]